MCIVYILIRYFVNIKNRIAIFLYHYIKIKVSFVQFKQVPTTSLRALVLFLQHFLTKPQY